MLELERASKRYSSAEREIRAVDDVDLRVERGEAVAILGPSGSGKTTLLLLAGGLLKPDSGCVRVGGRDLASLSKRDLLAFRREELGFVFQNFNLVPGLSAAENVAMPLLLRGFGRRAASRSALRALEDVALADRAGHPPSKLSGGEQQRVAIARALVGSPTLVLADEPTGNLDTETGNVALSFLRGLQRSRGAAMVIVTHDVDSARRSDRVLTMRDGRLAASELPASTVLDE